MPVGGAYSDKAECVAVLNKVLNNKTRLEVHNSAGVQSSGRIKYKEYVSVKTRLHIKISDLNKIKGAQRCHCECMPVMCRAVFTVYSTWQ